MHSPRAARGRRFVAALTAIALLTTLAGSAAAAPGGNGKAGFRTSIQAMLKPGANAPAGTVIDPLLTVGDALDNGFVFDSIPDGISLIRHGKGTVELFVNHETSLVPFPIPPTVPIQLDDFTNSHVDRLVVNQHSAGVVDGEDAIPSDANFQRFCSNFLAGAEHGFDRRILFTNEEATDLVYRTGVAWPLNEPADPRVPEQAGVVVAYDVETGEYKSIYGMGRHNHENSVAIPDYNQLVVLSGDDTFAAPASQLYSYVAPNTDAVWNDTGVLYAFKSADPLTNDYGDLTLGESVAGTFIPVPEGIAKGDQTGLENWGNLPENNVFQFIRVEDIAYDRNDSHIVYFADTGEPRANNATSAGAGRLTRSGSTFRGPFMNGRIFKMVLNDANPLVVDGLSVLIDADVGAYNNPNVIHQPDNLETTANSLLIQEDPGSHNQFALSNPAGVGARVWRYDLTDGSLEAVIEVEQSLDGADPTYDVGGGIGNRGAWESSGIIDASSIWGDGWFLIDVQAGTLILESTLGSLGGQAVRFEREGGQLLRVKIPGA